MNFKPKLRQENYIDFTSALRGVVFQHIYEKDFPFKNCLNCLNFSEDRELCQLWNAKPPARVIAFGCDKHEDEKEIPF